MKKSILMVSMVLVGCSASEQALLSPEASYMNRQKVSAIPAGQGITVIGSLQDEAGNNLQSYPAPEFKAHKVVHIYPVPESVFVNCYDYNNEYVGHQLVTTKKTGMGFARTNFQAGKTYMVFCNLQSDDRYQVSVKEVPNGTRYGAPSYYRQQRQSAKPTKQNQVNFVISTQKSTQDFWRGEWGNYMAIRNWDGKFGKEAKLALPIDKVQVDCQMRKQRVVVPLVGNFEAGKTYKLGCRENEQGMFEAYVVSEQ